MKGHFLMTIFNLTIFVALAYVYGKNALHMFQQQRYEINRYTKWLFNKNNIHISNVFFYFAVELILFLLNKLIFKDSTIILLLSLLFTIGFTVYVVYKESKRVYIKDLVITKRVTRQIIVYTILLVLSIYLILLWFKPLYFVGIFSVYLPYLLIYPMHFITYPIEELIKKSYEQEARKKLAGLSHLKKIGITGSYGKTSTKNIINDVISDNYYTHITPASYNTPMGITKTIRENLRPIHEIFVCEMGADKVGDISYLMDFVKPQFGVVTSIGPQHLATFKSMDNIIKEKMQEIEMLPADGIGFLNGDNEFINNYQVKNTCKIIKVGIENKEADYVATNIKYSNSGSTFCLKLDGKNRKFETSLLGKHNITNILIGIAIAKELGISNDDIVKNVKGVRQVEHRLQVKKINNLTFIDDAFNSNPVGSKMAIDVLSSMKGKRVIVTPGMIDLGPKQDEYNYEFGKYMLDKVDCVLLVGEKQTKSIVSGLKDVGYNMDDVKVFKDVRDALNYVYTKFTSEDTILLENDLPDAFNV